MVKPVGLNLISNNELEKNETRNKTRRDETRELWYLKHAPQAIDEVAGNNDARELVKKWALDWNRGKKNKPLLFWGPTGVGKTALANAVAREFNWTLITFSANTERGKKDLNRFFAPQASETDLYGTRKILVVDEVDAVFDHGQIPILSQLLQETRQPTIIIAEDAWNPKLTPIRSLCTLVQFKKINWIEINKVLLKTLARENIRAKTSEQQARITQITENIARESGGDVRSALIDLQATLTSWNETSENASGNAFLSKRERKQNVFDALRKMFGARSFTQAIEESDSVDEELDYFLKWVDENLPLQATEPQRLAASLNSLSKADVFAGRLNKRQDYSLFKYVRALGCGGVAVRARNENLELVKYKFPTVLKKLGDSKNARGTLASILKKIITRLHCSKSQALETVFLLSDSKNASKLSKFLELTEQEAKFLTAFKT